MAATTGKNGSKMNFSEAVKERMHSNEIKVQTGDGKERKISTNENKNQKDKMVSIKVNSEMYQRFTDICKKRGCSKNSKINELIYEFISKEDKM